VTHVERLQKRFRELFNTDSVHVTTIAFEETVDGKRVERIVQVFFLPDHPQTSVGYGWTELNEQGDEDVVLLRIPPIATAVDAIRVYAAMTTNNKK